MSGTLFGHSFDGSIPYDELMHNMVYNIKIKGNLLERVKFIDKDAPDTYTGIYLKKMVLKFPRKDLSIYPTWILIPSCEDGQLPESAKYFYYEFKLGDGNALFTYVFPEHEDIEISGPLKEPLRKTLEKCSIMGGKKRKRKSKRKSLKHNRN